MYVNPPIWIITIILFAKSGAGLLPAQPVEHPTKEATNHLTVKSPLKIGQPHLCGVIIYNIAVGFGEEDDFAYPLQPLQGALHAGHSKATTQQPSGAKSSTPPIAERFIGEQIDLWVDEDVLDTGHWLAPNLMHQSYQM